MNKRRPILLFLVFVWFLAACQQANLGQDDLSVTVHVDGKSTVHRYDRIVSVGQFLEAIGVVLGDLDEVNPSIYSQLEDGMRITVTRVVEYSECETEPLEFETIRQPSEQLSPDDPPRVAQPGVMGEVQVCYLITEKDGVVVSRNPGRPVTIKAPVDEILWVGVEPQDTLISIEGVLTYITGEQAWIIEGNTTNRRALTTEGRLDGRVFELSVNGRQLLFTRRTEDTTDPASSNELWAILDATAVAPEAMQLYPEDVRSADWVPGQGTYTVSYSTMTPTSDAVGWRAFNDLFVMQLDSETGEVIGVPEEIIPSNNLGAYSYWGRRYVWSPDGSQVAWALADSVGLVNRDTGDYVTLLTFSPYSTILARSSVWVPTLSWSEDGRLVTTVHGAPYAVESPEESIIFDTAVVDTSTGFQIPSFFSRSGIWTNAAYSPMIEDANGNPTYSVAFFKAREPLNSLGAEYDLWIADSDGSNTRLLFPGPDRPGFRSPDPEDGIAWSPEARQIAFIYQKNLWIFDFETDLPYQITSDGQASRPRWSQ
jgi:hypothetical protein